MSEQVEVYKVNEQEEEIVGNLVVQRDALLTVKLAAGKQLMQDYLERAKAINPQTETDVVACGMLIQDIKHECEPLVESLSPFKAQLTERLDMIRSIEKCFTVSVAKPQQVTAKNDERYIAYHAVDLIKTKMNDAIDRIQAEKERIAREAEEKARKAQEAALKKTNEKLDRLLSQSDNLIEQKHALENRLENDGDVTVEEAENIRARIEKIEAQIYNAQAKIAEKQVEQATMAQPVTVVAEPTKMAGLSTKIVWVPTVTAAKLLLQAVINGSVPMSVLKVDLGELKRHGNAMVKGQANVAPTVPGVSWVPERDTRNTGR